MFNEEIWKISQQNITCFRIFLQNRYLALEYSGKKCTLENGTSPGTPFWQVPPNPTPPRVVTSCVPAWVEKLITVKPLSRGQRWDPENVSSLQRLVSCLEFEKVRENEVFSIFRVFHQWYLPCYKTKRKCPLVTNFIIIAILEIGFSYVSFAEVHFEAKNSHGT